MTNLSLARASLFLLFSLMFSATGLARPSVVVIDPGHGGHDRGGIPGQRLAEKVFTLDTAKRLARILRNDTAMKVVLTRDDDTFVSLEDRTNIANQYAGHNALFVSIHFNAGRREGAYGIETYYNNQRGYRLAAFGPSTGDSGHGPALTAASGTVAIGFCEKIDCPQSWSNAAS